MGSEVSVEIVGRHVSVNVALVQGLVSAEAKGFHRLMTIEPKMPMSLQYVSYSSFRPGSLPYSLTFNQGFMTIALLLTVYDNQRSFVQFFFLPSVPFSPPEVCNEGFQGLMLIEAALWLITLYYSSYREGCSAKPEKEKDRPLGS